MGMMVDSTWVPYRVYQVVSRMWLISDGSVSPRNKVFDVPSVTDLRPIGAPPRPNVPRTWLGAGLWASSELVLYPQAGWLQYLANGVNPHLSSRHCGPMLPT